MNIHNVFHRFLRRKPERKLLRAGTFVLIDTANLLGCTGPQHAARILEAVSAELAAQGCRAMFFLEYRSYVWVRSNQDSDRDALLLDVFVERGDFALVDEDGGSEKSEADAVILQVAEALPDSVCLTRDKFKDYAGIHPDIVPDRVMGFTVVKLDDRMLIAVKGLKRAISINVSGIESVFTKSLSTSEVDASTRTSVGSADNHCNRAAPAGGVCGRKRIARCTVRDSAKPSKKNLQDIRALAVCGKDGDWDRYESLDYKQEKRRVESERRYFRLRVQAIRDGRWRPEHFSLKRRRAVGIAALSARINYRRVA